MHSSYVEMIPDRIFHMTEMLGVLESDIVWPILSVDSDSFDYVMSRMS